MQFIPSSGGATYSDKYYYYGEVFSLSNLSQTSWDLATTIAPRAFHIVAQVAQENCTTSTGSCPEGWSQFEGKCYKFVNETKVRSEARDDCLSEQVLVI